MRTILAVLALAGVVLAGAMLRAAPPTATGTGWDLVFADEFNGASVDTVKWLVASPTWTMPNSLSTATASQVTEASGNLILNATRTGSSNAFTSGSVSTYGIYTWDSGYIEARIALPTTLGSWPAFWGLYNGWPPEADIMEYPITTDGGTSGLPNSQYNTSFHYAVGSGNSAGAGVVDPSGVAALNTSGTTYHTFGMHWVKGASVTYYFDGTAVSSYSSSNVAQMVNMYLILDYAVGGWPGTPSLAQWPAGASDQTKVDYLRVWQQRTSGATTTSTWKINGGGTWTTSGNWTGIVPTFGGQQAVFGNVGSATTAAVSWTRSLAVGGLTFGGSAATGTAYTLTGDALQLTGSGGTANANIQALATSTVNQTVNSRIELYNSTDITNNMATGSLILNGLIVGDGDLTVSGPGPVQFANNNTYTGDTYIGTTANPAATAVVVRSRPFGTVGTLFLGITNNPNAALIRISGTRAVPNTVLFAGRGSLTDNLTPAIQNVSDNNEFSGTLNIAKGGTNYIVQSDAGTLTLSGTADAATPGVAVQAGAGVGGSRTLTLQGAGNGVVSGIVQNGSASVLSITKTGTGTWTLSGINTYTGGATTVSAGTLAVTGSLAGGGTLTAAAGAVLSGNGSIAAATTINGTHSPGAGIGTQTFTGSLAYGSTAHLAWELAGNTTAPASADRIAAGAVTVAGGAKIDVVLNGSGSTVNFTNTFWLYPQQWTVLGGTSLGGNFAMGSVSADAGGRSAASYGTFAVQPSGTSAVLTFTPINSVPVPQQPTGLSVVQGDHQVVLTWSAANGATSYTVSRATAAGGPYTVIASGLTATTYTDTTAANGTTYYYAIAAVNPTGASMASSQANATPALGLHQYAADASTLVLFHFDEAAGGTAAANAGTLGGNAYSVNMTTASATPATITTALGAGVASYLGSSATFASGQLIGWDYNNSGTYDGDVNGAVLSADNLPMSLLNMGNGGQTPWTVEALVYCTLPTLNANQEIVCTDGSAASTASRGFQFRLNASGQLELNLIAVGKDITLAIPTSGTHAYAANTWFHMAAVYDGTNVQLYWTRADPSLTTANLLGATAASVGTVFGAATGPLCIGGENRGANGEAFQGRIDEVRISNVARPATAMLPAWRGSNPPALAAVADRTLAFNTASGPITLTLSDIDSPVDSLTLGGTAANPSLIPAGNIVFSGAGASRVVTITPAANATGTTAVTLTVSDGLASSTRSFNVTVLDQTYTWRQQNFGANWNNDAVSGDAADPDGDGVSNLLERAFAGNPNAADLNLLPAPDATATPFNIVYRRANAATDLTYTVQESPDLAPGSWVAATGTSTVLSDDGTVQTVRFTAPPGSTGRKFLRVQVTKSPNFSRQPVGGSGSRGAGPRSMTSCRSALLSPAD